MARGLRWPLGVMKNALPRLGATCLLLWLASAGTALAQPRGVLLEPRLRGTDVEGVGHALDRVVHAQLQSLNVLSLAPTPALGIEDLQLAVGCVAETAECLTAVAAQLDVSTLVHLDVERAGTELLLTLAIFEVGATEIRTVTRRVGGDDAEARALDEVEPMVRQAFGLPPPEPAASAAGDGAVDGGPSHTSSDPAAPSDDGGGVDVPILPIVFFAAGAVALGVAIGVGVQSQDTLAQYERATIAGGADVDVALGIYDRASSEATASSVLFAVSGVLLAGGVVAWIVQAVTDDGGDSVAFAPVISPDQAGLVLAGRFGGAR